MQSGHQEYHQVRQSRRRAAAAGSMFFERFGCPQLMIEQVVAGLETRAKKLLA
jgi:hypothetical protein